MSERALHIPPAVLALDLSLLACAVLAEVIDLYQVNGQVFASDEHFAQRCHSKPRTIRETIAELEGSGHLTREVNYAARHKRLLTPAEQWRNLPEVVADFATSGPEVVAESATTQPEVVADSAGSSGEIRQNLWRNPPGVVAKSANINTNLNTTLNTTQAPRASALVESSSVGKKSEPARRSLPSDNTQLAPPVALPPQPAAPRSLAKAPAAPSFEEFWDAYGKKLDTKKCRAYWQTLPVAQRTAAMAALPAYVAATASDVQFRKHPITWLRGECWHDDPPPPRAPAISQSDTSSTGRPAASPTKARQKTDW